MTEIDKNKLMDTCLLAGRMMIEGGSEMYRVEDTMNRIAANAGVKESVVFTTPTGIFIAIRNESFMQLRPIGSRTINLEKVSRVNEASRRFAAKRINLEGLYQQLLDIDRHTPSFPLWLQLICAAFVSNTLMVLFSGVYDWYDFPIAGVVGAIGYLVFYLISKITTIRFLSEFVASFVVGLTAFLSVKFGLGQNIDNIIIGAVMPLVPGVAITNSFRDMLAGHLLSGMARGTEAVLSACAIGTGIALIFRFFM